MKNPPNAADDAPSPRSLWLRAAFGAPALLFISAALLTMCLGEASLTSRLGASIRGIIVAPFAGLLYGAILVVVDFALALVRLRRLPTGVMAWVSGCVATIVGAVLSAITLSIRGSVADETFAVIVLVLVCCAALGVRLVFGQRPERKPSR